MDRAAMAQMPAMGPGPKMATNKSPHTTVLTDRDVTRMKRPINQVAGLKVVLRAAKPEAPPRDLRVPVVGVEIGGQLGNLRFDPPIGSEVEIVSVGLLRRPQQIDDYLIRLTSQFQWSLGDPQSVRFSSESQVLLDSVYLRTGD